MSERGLFVTEYIHCDKCFEVLKKILISRDKYLCSTSIPAWGKNEKELPIIAGKLGSLYQGGEIHLMHELRVEAEKVICHPITVSVISEYIGPEIVYFHPQEKNTDDKVARRIESFEEFKAQQTQSPQHNPHPSR